MSTPVSLRDVAREDLPTLFEHQRDPIANHMACVPARDEDAFLAHWSKLLEDETVTKQTILYAGRVAGLAVSFERFGKREVGYWIAREHWGKGIATRALSELLGLVKARPLYARVVKHNVASIRVVEKCGFQVSSEEQGTSNPLGDGVEEVLLKLDA